METRAAVGLGDGVILASGVRAPCKCAAAGHSNPLIFECLATWLLREIDLSRAEVKLPVSCWHPILLPTDGALDFVTLFSPQPLQPFDFSIHFEKPAILFTPAADKKLRTPCFDLSV
jgi:hypothetical protein